MSVNREKPELNDNDYRRAVKAYRKSSDSALSASIRLGGKKAGERAYWASVLFLRVVLISGSISKLLPELDAEGKNDWWDFASLACLLRAMFEASLFFLYFTESCGEDEWLARLNLMQLNDCTERIRFFKGMKEMENVELLKEFEPKLIEKLECNPYFTALDARLQKTLLYGFRQSILSQREIADRFKFDQTVWSIFQFLSNYTHTHAMRTYEQERFGMENEMDKNYFAVAIDWITPILESVVKQYETVFVESTM
jgi:hypothetical protein